jgi:hypothetical protein
MADGDDNTRVGSDPSKLTTQQLDRAILSLESNINIRLDAMDKASDLIHEDYVRVPTVIDREISALRNALADKMEGLSSLSNERYATIQSRFDAADLTIIRQFAERDIRTEQSNQSSRTAIDAALEALSEKLIGMTTVTEEKFASVARQFIERDVRTEQAAVATKIAVDAALQAQKEAAGAQNESNAAAITKSEAATAKQLDGITILLNSNKQALDDKIADLKGRLDRGEGVTSNARDNVSDRYNATMVAQGGALGHGQSNSNTIAMVAAGLAFVAIMASVLIPHLSH